MAIKIQWRDLQARYYNWQPVQKVYLNWAVIWPYEQAPVDYHVIWDIDQCQSDNCMHDWWWYGWGWGWYWWWGWVYSPGWSNVYWRRALPNLRPAKKIVITQEIYWTWTHDTNDNAVWWDLNHWWSQSFGSNIKWRWWAINRWWVYLNLETWASIWSIFQSISLPWTYTLVWDINLVDWIVTVEVKEGNVVIADALWAIDANTIYFIRWCSEFRFVVWEWVTLPKVDFYVYYQLPNA